MIYINAVRKLIDPQDKNQQRPIFTIKFSKLSTGALVPGKCVCTSTNWQRDMVTVKFLPSNKVRSFRALKIIEFNGEEVLV